MKNMKYALFALLILSAGCAGLDTRAQKELGEARVALASDPMAALRQADSVLDSFPKNCEVLVVRAQALEALDRRAEAISAWARVIHVDSKKSDEQLLLAHTRLSTMILERLGPLPHAVANETRGTERKHVEEAQASLNYLLEQEIGDLQTRILRIQCYYRIGRHGLAASELRAVKELDTSGEHSEWINYMQCLVQEHLTGSDDTSLATMFRLVRSDDPSLRDHVVSHLIHLLSQGKVTTLQKSNIRGVLVRTSRQDDAPSMLVTWSKEFHENERARLDTEHYDEQFKEIDQLLATREYDRAWTRVETLPAAHPEVDKFRQKVARTWTRVLLAKARDQLTSRKLDACAMTVESIQLLPPELLSEQLAKKRAEIVTELEDVTSRRIVKKHLNRAEDAMRRRKEEEALAHLEGLEELATAEERVKIHLIRARALFDSGDRQGALASYDQVGEVESISDRRKYGVLLSEAGRADEAARFLDLMPLTAMKGETLDALIDSLERQGSWDKLLSRLSDIDPLPARYRPTLMRATVEAAKRRLRLRTPDRALEILTSYLTQEQRRAHSVFPTYFAAVLRTGNHDEARSLLVRATPTQLSLLSQELVFESLDSLGDSIEDEMRYDLLKRVAGNTLTSTSREAIEMKLRELAPRFGNYLPQPGEYTAEYRITSYDPDTKRKRMRTENLALTWKVDRFHVVSDSGPAEDWWIDQGVWHRKTSDHTQMIPVKVANDTANPRESYESATALWVSTVVKSGTEVIVGGRTYTGCIRIQLVPNEDESNRVTIDLAPEVGEVRREVYREGALTRLHELTDFSIRD